MFGSHGSAATISALLFNFGYRPGPHCSPEFPNLGGIPPPGNMVYKRRHQAQPLAETTETPPPPTSYPSPSWQYLLCDLLYPFPFHPSSNIPSTPLPCWYTESPGLSHQGVSQRGAGLSSILTCRHTETCVVCNWF